MRKELSLVLGHEKRLYYTILIYTIFIGAISISIPLSIQTLVNIVPSTLMYYPLVLLCIVLLILLTLSTVIYGIQIYVTELFKRRIFVRIASMIVTRTLYFENKTIQTENTEQILDRFFEIPNIQSSTTAILIGFFTAAVQIAVSIIISSLYHPMLLIFNLIFTLAIYYALKWQSGVATKTAIKESSAKYVTASWLSEVGRKYFYMRSCKSREFATKKTNTLIANYISARKKHFKYLFSQILYLLVIYIIGNVALLFICGMLVLEEKLTLGQFVATEVFFTYTFGHILKVGGYLEYFYKLIASCNKISYFYKIPIENYNDKTSSFEMNNIHILSTHIPKIPYPVSLHINLDGSYHLFLNLHERTKSFLMSLFMGWNTEYYSSIQVDDIPFSEINLDKYRDKVSFIDSSNIICTTIKEFTTFTCPTVSHSKFESILKLVGIYEIVMSLPEKEQTKIISPKYPLNKEEVIRLKIAKALLEEPKLLLIDYPIADHIILNNRPLLEYIIHNPNLTLIHFTSAKKAEKLAQHIYRFDEESQSITHQNV